MRGFRYRAGLAIMAFLSAITTHAHAADFTIFGLELGKPLNLPECKRISGTNSYEVTPQTTCVQAPRQQKGYGQPVRTILFTLNGEIPAIMRNIDAYPLEVDGNMVGFHFYTRGLKFQKPVLDDLTQKYGKPTRLTQRTVRDQFGMAYAAITAVWDSGALLVTYEGVTDNLERGQVFIDLPAAAKLRASWQANARPQ